MIPGVGIGLKLLGIFGWLKKLAAGAKKFAVERPREALIIVLLIMVAVQTWRLSGVKDDLTAANEGWAKEQVARRADRDAYTAAQAEAKRLAEEAKARTEAQYADLARRADNAENETAGLRAASGRFAAARRLSGPCQFAASGSASGQAPAAPEGGPAPDRDRPGADAVVLTRPEYDQLVENSIRLERVRLWGESLIKADLALPEPAFGKD